MILAGDIGGTKTTLALFALRREVAPGFGRDSAIVESFASRDFAEFHEILNDFCGRHRPQLAAACVAIAGPVRANRCRATNLPWTVDGVEIAGQLGLDRAWLLNDLEAIGYGIDVLEPQEISELHPGAPGARGNRAVIAAGTGLGEAGLYWDGSVHWPFATEGGHADFAPRDEDEIALLRFLRRRYEQVGWERVVSGPGLVDLGRFLLESADGGSAPGEAERFRAVLGAADPGAAMSRLAASGESALAARALDLFVRLYGAEAGNLALKTMATGGLYVGGGIAPRNLERMRRAGFLEAFFAKDRMRPLLEAMPVRILLNEETALLGAARCAVLHRAAQVIS